MNLKYYCVEDITMVWLATACTAYAARYGANLYAARVMSGRPFDTWIQWVGVSLAAILYAIFTPGYTLSFGEVSFHFLKIKGKSYPWERYPYAGRVPKGVKVNEGESTGKDTLYFSKKKLKRGKDIPGCCYTLKYTEEMEAILCIFCPYLENPDIALWKERLSDVRVWSDAELQENRNKVKRYKLFGCAMITPAIIGVAVVNNFWIPIIIAVIFVGGWNLLEDKCAPEQEKVEQEYQRALLKRLVLYLSPD
jgi:hypothetical protein